MRPGQPTRRVMAAGLGMSLGMSLGAADVARALGLAASVQLEVSYNGWEVLAPWTEAVRRRVETWWPVMTSALASPGFHPAHVVRIVFFSVTPQLVAHLADTPLYRRLGVHAAGVAAVTRDTTIHVNAPFVLARLGDPGMFGMMAHELTHVIQAYPRGATTWLAEGIADYMRFYVLTPDDPGRRFNPRRETYDSGYQATAGLLAWVDRARPGAVREINAALRRGGDGVTTLVELTGSPPQALWRAYLESYPAEADLG